MPPEVPHASSAGDNVGVVKLVIVANPSADESPGGLHSRVSAEASHLLGLALYKKSCKNSNLFFGVIKLTKGGAAPEVLGSETSNGGSETLLVKVGKQMRHFNYYYNTQKD